MTNLKLPTTGDGPRVEPRQPHEVSVEMVAEYEKARWRWGIHNNLMKTMAGFPQLGFTEVDYANSFIFDGGTWVDWPLPGEGKTVKFPTAGFIDRVTKELVISLVSLLNRSRYSITHHTMIGFTTISGTVGAARAEKMLLELVDANGDAQYENAGSFEEKPLFSAYQLECLRYAERANDNAHGVTDDVVSALRNALESEARRTIPEQGLGSQFEGGVPEEYVDLWVDAMFLELTWNVCHFGGLLNSFFTILKMHDEQGRPPGDPGTFADGFFPNFVAACDSDVPDSIKVRNNNLLGSDGFGNR